MWRELNWREQYKHAAVLAHKAILTDTNTDTDTDTDKQIHRHILTVRHTDTQKYTHRQIIRHKRRQTGRQTHKQALARTSHQFQPPFSPLKVAEFEKLGLALIKGNLVFPRPLKYSQNQIINHPKSTITAATTTAVNKNQ